MRQASLEELLVCQDADAIGPVLLVNASDGDWVEIGANDTGGRRGFLHLGDDPHSGFAKCGGEIARRSESLDAALQFYFGDFAASRSDLDPLALNNRIQNGHDLVCHGRSAFSFAAVDSILSARLLPRGLSGQ